MSTGFIASDYYNSDIATASTTNNSYGPAFRPVRGKEERIQQLPVTDGYVYYAYDTGKIFIDKDTTRITMGSAGSAIYYGEAENLTEVEEELYHFPIDALENENDSPKVDDIILNSDGAFYRILSIGTDYFECQLLSVSGTGGGGGEVYKRPSLNINTDKSAPANIINGSEAKIYFTATSATDEDGSLLDNKLTVSWSLITSTSGVDEQYYTGNVTVESGKEDYINVGPYLRDDTSTTVKLVASSGNHDAPSRTRSHSIATTNLVLKHISSFNPATTYNTDDVVLNFIAEGDTEKIIYCYFDGELIDTKYLSRTDPENDSFIVAAQYRTHGAHSVRLELYQNEGSKESPRKGQFANALEYEIAIVEAGNSEAPVIIWLGEYKSVYYNYDSIQIPFLVYNPKNTQEAVVSLYKDAVKTGELTITNFSDFTYWEIADAEMDKVNYYKITSGDTDATRCEREIKFTVEKDPVRDMTIRKQSQLKLNFDPTGRSNNESAIKRQTWTYGEGDAAITASMTGFNWYNNGWYMDPDTKITCLRISNGAKFSIPFGNLVFGSNDASMQSNTVEVQFKVRNIQNYKNLITNITRYNGDDEYYAAYIAQKAYNNYDAFLQATLDATTYEKLEFNRVQKDIDLTNVIFGFYSGAVPSITGICIGPQDTFFSNGTNTVSVSFVDNEMINLSFVYNHTLQLMYVYINGVITGVIKSSDSVGSFTIQSNDLVFNSDYCDIDLYKIRIYNTDLNVNDIVINYAVDRKDVEIYDQNVLAKENTALKEYQLDFNQMLKYNEEHPDAMLMPYIIYDTSKYSDNKLPWSKEMGTRDIEVTFVNTLLDRAYETGQLEKLARADGLIPDNASADEVAEGIRTYYKHHSPSWVSTLKSGDTVTIEVQGTSSEFYPRRNFKIKTKYEAPNTWGDLEDDDGNVIGQGWTEEECYNIFMNRGPFADIYKADQIKLAEDDHYYGAEESRLVDGWYMNNYTNPTDRWTMKVDYMESSGSYNAGFASMMGQAYTKHPLKDYLDVLTNTDKLENNITGGINWKDYRTSLLGFPVMAFQKRADGSYLFIGYYRMLLDKSSTQVLGFKTPKKVEHTLVLDTEGKPRKLRDVAECWEFSTNARTFCSFRDPWKRVQFKFKAPAGVSDEFTSKYAPVVMNHFEYRYTYADDFLDSLMEYSTLTQDDLDELVADIEKETGWDLPEYTAIGSISADGATEDQKNNARAVSDLTLKFYENYEKVCAWIWSTNLDNVVSQGFYNLIQLGNVLFEANKYYKLVYDEEAGENKYELAETYDADYDGVYYSYTTFIDGDGKEVKEYSPVYVVNDSSLLYKANTFYTKVDDNTYALATSADFDSSETYYSFTSLSDEEQAKIADLLIERATEFDANTTYYTYNGNATISPGKPTGAVVEVGTLADQETFDAGEYYVAAPKTYVGVTYKYDTQEYRAAKFTNEFTKHFDPEYVSTYFIMTEVFECYDSRGKNCMMASWGPQKEGGEYIWYPIFYDIDTQLGINNTGIPSFEFNVDATEAGNYSTSDSLLWNNFYKFFKNSYILTKYQNLRGIKSSWDTLEAPPLESVDYIEGWYSFDYDVTKNLATSGVKPMIATNLDEYFKYITITNSNAIAQGVAYLQGNEGVWAVDKAGTYFYALQGDRSQSRRQFLTNRIEYIDSWLGQKNYSRGGGNRIRGRLSANSTTTKITSDQWVETTSDPYWVDDVEFGTKTHEFDAEYWLTLTPIRSSYVTAGDDSANYAPQKFDGINSVKYTMKELENGIRSSANYPEQLIYIYGMNQMSDFGDLSKLYFTEFYMEGDASHLTRLQLGSDGVSDTDLGTDGNAQKWYNKKLNGITLEDMPLLQEANFSNIGLQNETNLSLTASEKLRNFRAVGTSKLTGVTFADGVALDTLYLPESVTTLSLVQANLLKKLIKTSAPPTPTKDEKGNLVAEEGLFLGGFFTEPYGSNLTAINLNGGALGYGSYDILMKFYDQRKSTNGSKLTMQDVNWSPYVLCVEGDEDDGVSNYYLDNGHYGFEYYDRNEHTTTDFNNYILNGKIYKYVGPPESTVSDDFVEVLRDLHVNTGFNDGTGTTRPIITGIVYVENSTPLEEAVEIAGELQEYYPDLKLFFANVTRAYSAEFLYKNPTTGAYEYVTFADGSKKDSVQKIAKTAYEADNTVWFESPFGNKVYDADGSIIFEGSVSTGLYNPSRTHYDFRGWSTDPEGETLITTPDEWNALTINPTQEVYTYYAIFTITHYDITFYDGDGSVLAVQTYSYGTTGIDTPADKVPWKDDSELSPVYMTYGLIGWAESPTSSKLVDLTTYEVRNVGSLYPIFEEKSVYDNVNRSYFSGALDGSGVSLTLVKKVRGKITVPSFWELDGVSYPVLAINSSFCSGAQTGVDFTPMGQELTHVFFELDTQIATFKTFTFSSNNLKTSKLKYVEFPESLTTIDMQAFYRANALDFSEVTGEDVDTSNWEYPPRIYGENVNLIGQQAFMQAFASKTVTNFNIGSKVKSIGGRAFYNIGLNYTNANIGTPTELSVLDLSYNTDPILNKSGAALNFYSAKYDKGDSSSLASIFPGMSLNIT